MVQRKDATGTLRRTHGHEMICKSHVTQQRGHVWCPSFTTSITSHTIYLPCVFFLHQFYPRAPATSALRSANALTHPRNAACTVRRSKMGILDGITLYMAKGVPPPSPPSAPLLCLFFSAQWCPGEIRILFGILRGQVRWGIPDTSAF